MADVAVPDTAWDDDSEGVVSVWFYSDGDNVAAGAVLCELMNEKVASELAAPCAGRLTVLVPAEAPVRKGQLVARIE